MLKTVSEHIFDLLVREKITDTVFSISGGGNMYLIDALSKNSSLRRVHMHHEQALAMAAEGYSRYNWPKNKKIGVALVTTGPGGTNAITGLAGMWFDYIPGLIISGQVQREYLTYIGRQKGDQEIDITRITKYLSNESIVLRDLELIRYELERIVYNLKNSPTGPYWIDVPLDIQRSVVDWDSLCKFDPPDSRLENYSEIFNQIEGIANDISNFKKPLICFGGGVRNSKYFQEDRFYELLGILKETNIPFVSTTNGRDVVSSEPEFIGTFGVGGNPEANYAIEECDLLISIGSRLSIRNIGFNTHMFAKKAKKIIINIYNNEYGFAIDEFLNVDAFVFLENFLNKIRNKKYDYSNWLSELNGKRSKHSYLSYKNKINIYEFVEHFSHINNNNFVTSNGTAIVSSLTHFANKRHKRFISNKGLASMGYGLPASIGVCFASNESVVCLEGDGSIMMNLQELQTVKHYQLPLLIVIINNKGYSSIRQTQKRFLEKNYVDSFTDSGDISLPDFVKLGNSLGIISKRVKKIEEFDEIYKEFLKNKNPIIIDLICEENQNFYTRIPSKSPFLPGDLLDIEVDSNCGIL